MKNNFDNLLDGIEQDLENISEYFVKNKFNVDKIFLIELEKHLIDIKQILININNILNENGLSIYKEKTKNLLDYIKDLEELINNYKLINKL